MDLMVAISSIRPSRLSDSNNSTCTPRIGSAGSFVFLEKMPAVGVEAPRSAVSAMVIPGVMESALDSSGRADGVKTREKNSNHAKTDAHTTRDPREDT